MAKTVLKSLLLLVLCGVLQTARAAKDRPNVLLIVTDDQGIGDFGFMGNDTVKTPNLDRLAEQSAHFTNFVVAPACSPTRSSLMTGRNHMKAGVWGVGPRNNLMRDEILMPQYFKSNGYGTGYFGKGDGVGLLELKPWDRGCDEAEYPWGYDHLDPRMITPEGVIEREGWTCDINVDFALDYIRRQGDQPWWCTVAYIIPHLPWEPPETYAEYYRKQGCSERLAAVYGSITQMDDATGHLLRELEKMGHIEDTIIVFLSDNGPSYKDMTEEEIESRNSLELRGTKATAWDNGIRVPLLVRWPGTIEPGPRPQFASVEDILPTLADLTGLDPAKFPEHHPWDGVSLRSALQDPDSAEIERTVFRVAISGEGAAGGARAVVNHPDEVSMREQHVTLRGPRFKYHNYADGSSELFDLDADPGETVDVSDEFPEIAARYAAELEDKYEAILDTGRAYRMPWLKVGRYRPGYNKLNSVMAQKIYGDLKGVGFHYLKGFAQPGDRAEYAIEVVRGGEYTATMDGKQLDHGGGWMLRFGDTEVRPETTTPQKVTFPPFTLGEGRQTMTLTVEGSGEQRDPPLVQKIYLAPPR
ncbi:sulfatase-like hydrolase/transferase [Kiritimatiella glycovorans]|uniref:Arylsulfatase n=1 Tax=Kiritimatiella glycovorans TaxID=1307763 RepID=A0A0G3EI33_9BACT|nr:sulfatase-like hydrolase/transferase [Kiritimatiella glycovorans]AKJ64475.1 Arylsulfatase [Kiritimatiella glycovorans]